MIFELTKIFINIFRFKRIEEPSRNRTVVFNSEYENETLTHFSTFALSAEDGSFLWKHTSGDFEKPKQEEKVIIF